MATLAELAASATSRGAGSSPYKSSSRLTPGRVILWMVRKRGPSPFVFDFLSLGEFLAAKDAAALLQDQQLIRRNVLKRFHQPQGPADFDRIHLLGLTEPKMQARIILRQIAGTA